jgi:DNA-binding transcriptional MerR regulator
MKVGEVAKRTGLSVRTLHYYDEIGLLSPAEHTASRHRLYGAPELLRLQQIKSLRQLGFSLDEVRGILDDPLSLSPRQVLTMHAARLRAQIVERERVAVLLESLAVSFSSADTLSVDMLIQAIEGITMIEKEFTPEELREIKARGAELGEARIRDVEAEWPRLIAQVRAEMEKGTDPTSETVRALVKRWRELVREFTGGNPNIERKLRAKYTTEPELRQRSGIEPALMEYVGKAMLG